MFSLCNVTRLPTKFSLLLLWRVRAGFFYCQKTSLYSSFMQKQNYIFFYLSNGVSSSNLKFCFVGTMFLSKSFIKAFRTFSTKLNVDGLWFSRYYKLFKSVVILCLTRRGRQDCHWMSRKLYVH